MTATRGSTRDTHRHLLYDAEQEIRAILDTGGVIDHFGSRFTVPDERKFGDVDSIAPYVEKVLVYTPIARLPRASVPLTVRERRGATKAHYEFDTATIAVPPYRLGARTQQGWALRELVILHEMAHHLCGISGHGPEFVAHFLHLVEHVIDPVAAHLLRVACSARGVQIGATP